MEENKLFRLGEVVSKEKARNYGGVVLAFIGDAVYSLFIREKLVETTDYKTGELNKMLSKVVCATEQAKRYKEIEPILTCEEIEIFKRARNAKKTSRAKNASVSDYNTSTGFEAVIGYLYITGDLDRLNFILNFEGKNED